MTKQTTKGFTLIELMIVVAIIGVIAAIAIPNIIMAIQRAKQRRTMADMRAIAAAWELRNTDVGHYNAAGGVDGVDVQAMITDVQFALEPTYIKHMPTRDSWNNDYAFFTDVNFTGSKGAQKYAVISGGHDGEISPGILAGAFSNYDCDIVYSQGAFLSYPDGFGLH